MQPGESGKIPLRIHTAKLSGPLSKVITVITNAPDAGATVQIKMSGSCWLPVEVTPRSASFGRLSSDQAAQAPTVKLTVVNNVEELVNLTDVKSTNPVFKAEVVPIEPGKKFEIVVSLAQTPDQPLPKGNASGQITVQTGLPSSPTVDVPVNAFITADVDVQPESLVLFSDRTSEQKRSFTIKNYTKTPITVSDLAASNPEVKVSMQEVEPGTTFRLDVTIPVAYKATPTGDKISMKTSLSTVPQLLIPITERQAPQGQATLSADTGSIKPTAGASGTPAAGGPAALQRRMAVPSGGPTVTPSRPVGPTAPPSLAPSTPPPTAAKAPAAAKPPENKPSTTE